MTSKDLCNICLKCMKHDACALSRASTATTVCAASVYGRMCGGVERKSVVVKSFHSK